MGQSKAITEGALLIAIYTIILLFALYIPFFILVGTFILPIPFIIYIVRHDWQVTLLFFLAAVFISSILATIVSLPLTILAGISSFFIGLSIRKELSPYDVWARGVSGYTIGLFLNVALIRLILDFNLYI